MSQSQLSNVHSVSFEPIRTERLILRQSRSSDAAAAFERRNIPEAARYQDWEMPYRMDRAEQRMADLVAMDGPQDDTGWSLTVVDATNPDLIVGDLALEVTWGGRSALVGYSFHPDYWGRAMPPKPLKRSSNTCSSSTGSAGSSRPQIPKNPPSLRVMEACGLVYVGLTRQSFWAKGECSEDILCGMPRPDWDAWRNRPKNRPDQIDLVPVITENRQAVANLLTHKSQERFVSSMLGNFRDIVAPPAENGAPRVPWYRAIEADGEIVGFIMTSEITQAHPNPYLWRFLIDRMHQRRGIGQKSNAQNRPYRCARSNVHALAF
jgi:RimJ/RimL family protein N-acetyltransferase